jgi:hypothetical protein
MVNLLLKATQLPVARPGVQRRLVDLSQPVEQAVERFERARTNTSGSVEAVEEQPGGLQDLHSPGPVLPLHPASSTNNLVSPRMPLSAKPPAQTESAAATVKKCEPLLDSSSPSGSQASASPQVILPPPKKRIRDVLFP